MKKAFNKFLTSITGYHLAKSNQDDAYDFLASKWAQSLDFKTIIDIGANGGQFALSARKALSNARIISMEPIPFEVEKIKNIFSDDSNFEIIETAVGEENYQAKLNLNTFSPASSILPATQNKNDYFPSIGDAKEIDVKVQKLDTLLKDHNLKKNILLKIDVQGFEDKVIDGAQIFLKEIKLVYVECSFVSIYKQQPLFDTIYSKLIGHGFEFRGVASQITAGISFEPVQVDAIFINKSAN